MNNLEFVLIILCFLIILYVIKRTVDRDRLKDIELQKKLEKDEFIYDPETDGKLTIEQAENGYSLIDPTENESGKSYIKVDEFSHEEVVNLKYAALPQILKDKVNKKTLSAVIGIIEEVTSPDMILTNQSLDKVYLLLKKYNLNLNKEEIGLIWEI